ncbi:MAG: hypothetical protein J7M25_17650 [Deltaproteobacteria bacterium]|nr:hypothetical protein [Deltaproteobacteria bacterium]
MAQKEKIEPAGIQKDNKQFLYYIKNGRVYRIRKKRSVEPKPKPEVAYEGTIQQEPGFIYFVDEDGDISRVPRAKGKKTIKTPKRKNQKSKKTTAKRRIPSKT